MPAPSLRLVLNPRAGAGSALRRLPAVRQALRALGIDHDVVETSAPGHAAQLTREAHADGVNIVGVMGGDGTFNEVAHAFIDADGKAVAGPELALIPAGTGGDYRRTLGITDSLDATLARIRDRPARAVDLGVLQVVGPDHKPSTRAFINITSFGIGGLTDRLVNEAPKWLGGQASFYLGSVRALASYRNQPVRVSVDGQPWFEGPALNVAVALGQFHGGGMKVAPDADPCDGLFDVIAIGDLSKVEALGLTSKLYSGDHLKLAKVSSTRGRLVEAHPVHAWSSVLIDMDGETPGQLPLRAEILPGAVSIRF
jgi:YegS/Rv2252/BmrU family lipid kinase